jgi:ribonuclease P/MRP protein subunit POP5
VIAELVKRNIKLLFGDNGEGLVALSLVVKYFSAKTSTGIIRCSRDHFKYVVAALTIINKINDKDVIVRVLRVSGTIKKSENFAIERSRRLMRDMNLKGEETVDEFENITEDEEDD